VNVVARSAINRLRAFARSANESDGAARCDVCRAVLADEHPHLVAPGALALSCACLACVASPPPGRLAVPRRADRLDAERAGAAWDRLGLPVNLGFVLATGAPEPRWIARLPGAAGATLAELGDHAGTIVREAVGDGLAPEVEALLFDRSRRVAYLVSIDRCFELTGILRAGGDADAFFAALAAAAEVRLG
jgi:Family of unknown function (DUF5947)